MFGFFVLLNTRPPFCGTPTAEDSPKNVLMKVVLPLAALPTTAMFTSASCHLWICSYSMLCYKRCRDPTYLRFHTDEKLMKFLVIVENTIQKKQSEILEAMLKKVIEIINCSFHFERHKMLLYYAFERQLSPWACTRLTWANCAMLLKVICVFNMMRSRQTNFLSKKHVYSSVRKERNLYLRVNTGTLHILA